MVINLFHDNQTIVVDELKVYHNTDICICNFALERNALRGCCVAKIFKAFLSRGKQPL